MLVQPCGLLFCFKLIVSLPSRFGSATEAASQCVFAKVNAMFMTCLRPFGWLGHRHKTAWLTWHGGDSNKLQELVKHNEVMEKMQRNLDKASPVEIRVYSDGAIFFNKAFPAAIAVYFGEMT